MARGAANRTTGTPANGEHRRVLLWGRAGFLGVGARERSFALYFGYADMPADAAHPSGRSGTSRDSTTRGAPRSRARARRRALDLDATAPARSRGAHDVVDQMSVAWVEPLGKWVMFYGGGITGSRRRRSWRTVACSSSSPARCVDVVIGNGAMRMRTADDPWGPWSPPRDLIAGGDPTRDPSTIYRAGRHTASSGMYGADLRPIHADTEVQPATTAFLRREYHRAVDPPDGNGVDLVWNASTWDPHPRDPAADAHRALSQAARVADWRPKPAFLFKVIVCQLVYSMSPCSEFSAASTHRGPVGTVEGSHGRFTLGFQQISFVRRCRPA